MKKICSKCGEEKDATKEFYSLRADTGNLRNECKSCERKRKKQNKKQHEPNTVCDFCGKPIYRSGYQLRINKNKFCGISCRNKANPLYGDKNPSWVNDKVDVSCTYCGKVETVTRRRANASKNYFCSEKCHNVWQKGKSVEILRPGHVSKKSIIICAYCGIERERFAAWIRNKKSHHKLYCSKKCATKAGAINRRLSGNPRWLGGVSFEPYPVKWSKELKEIIRERDKRTCQVCGKTEDEKGRRSDVHHIDYNKNNLDYNNLISLCNSCHCKTNKDREWWEKYFNALMEHKITA